MNRSTGSIGTAILVTLAVAAFGTVMALFVVSTNAAHDRQEPQVPTTYVGRVVNTEPGLAEFDGRGYIYLDTGDVLRIMPMPTVIIVGAKYRFVVQGHDLLDSELLTLEQEPIK